MMTEEEIREFFTGQPKQQGVKISKVKFPPLNAQSKPPNLKNKISYFEDIKISFKVELGQTVMPVREVLSWEQGSVIKIEKLVGEMVDLYINEQKFAQGEIIVINDAFGVRINSLLSSPEQEPGASYEY